MGDVSLGAWPVVATAVAVLVGAYTFVWSQARVSLRLAVHTLIAAAAATAVLALGLHAAGIIPIDIPRWLYLIAMLPFLGPSATGTAWSRINRPRKAIGVASIAMGCVVALLIVNQHYLYWPTLAELLGRDRTDPLVAAVDVMDRTTSDSSPAGSSVDLATHHAGAAMHDHGFLVDVTIPGTVSGFTGRRARIWLPPAFAAHPTRHRAVVLVIGGTPSWPSDWTRAGRLDRAATALASQRDGEAPIFVMVDANGSAFADTECVDTPRHRAETYLTRDVPNFIATHFAVDQPTRWGLLGYSEGGTCAVTLALRHPEQFSAFVDLAGDLRPSLGSRSSTLHVLFGGSQAAMAAHDPLGLLAAHRYPGLSAWFDVGRADRGCKKASHMLADAARRSGANVIEHQTGGGHDFGFVQHALTDALPWLSDQLQTTSLDLVPIRNGPAP